jgi:hypothetical protein
VYVEWKTRNTRLTSKKTHHYHKLISTTKRITSKHMCLPKNFVINLGTHNNLHKK